MLKQNKLIISLILIILGLALLIGLVFLTPLKKILTPAPVSQVPLTQPQLVEKRVAEVQKYDLALLKNDQNLCLKIDSGSTRELCYEKVAWNLKNALICEKIVNVADQNRCKYVIIKDKALTAKSIEPCKELGAQAIIDQCQIEVQSINFCQDEACLDSLR